MFWFTFFGLGVYDFDFVFAMTRFLVLPAVGWCLVVVLGCVVLLCISVVVLFSSSDCLLLVWL